MGLIFITAVTYLIFMENILAFKFEVSEDGYLSTSEFLEKFNYHHENHLVATPDGYFIEIHRIRGRKENPKIPSTAPTVLMMPGFCVPDGPFVMHGPGKSNGLCLSDEGFDVWMGNYRGSRYGRRHTNLTANDKEFWHFEFYEWTVVDCAAIIDYILNHVGKPKLHYAGYSLGGIGIHYLLSLRPEYNDKIKSLYLITAALSIKHTRSNFVKLSSNILNSYKKEIPYYTIPVQVFSKKAVYENYNMVKNPVRLGMFYGLLESVFGPFGPNYNISRHLTYTGQGMSGCPMCLFLEVTQYVFFEKFQMVDLGEELNLKKYGSKHPHVVNNSAIEPPKVYFYGENDYLVSAKDVIWTARSMKNVLEVIPLKDHNHGTTVLNTDIKEKITDHIARYVKMLD